MVSSLFSSIYMISKFKIYLSVDLNLALMYEKENVIFYLLGLGYLTKNGSFQLCPITCEYF